MIGTPVFAAVALLAFVGSYVALCALRPAANMLRLLDVAGTLKHHEGEVPLIGGLGILTGYLLALSIYPTFLAANTFFLIASALLVITGTLDDRFVLSPLLRLAVQLVVAATAVLGAGLAVNTIGAPFFTGAIEMGPLAVPFAILIFVGGINAWNMIDGIDGLAAVLAFIAFSCMLIVGGVAVQSMAASLLALLCGTGAFFLFNLPVHGLRRQRTFLGDAGSMLLGLAVVWHALAMSQGTTAVMSPITALWFVALPVYDVITTTVRRVLKGRSPLSGDRQHLHHLLQDKGLSPRQTLVAISTLALLGGAIGLSSHFAGISDGLMFTLFALLGAAYFHGVRRLARPVLSDNSDIDASVVMSVPHEKPAGRTKISVITVCFNAADTIADTIASIRSQSHPDIEYIVVDGGSTDGTLEIIAQNRDVVSVLITEPDNGMYDAANKGISVATGEIVGMLNADDYYADKDVLGDIASSVVEGCDAVYGDLHYVDRKQPHLIKRNWVAGMYARKSFSFGWMPPHPTFFLRRTAYETYGVFRLDFESAADYELMLRMLYKHSLKPRYINRVLVKMRSGGQSNASIANRIRANRQDKKAWTINGLKAAWYTSYMKPLSKLSQFIH